MKSVHHLHFCRFSCDTGVMAPRKNSPYTEEEVREVLHEIIKRLIIAGLIVIAVGVLIIVALKIWGG